jgi:tetratricopeptide (TPR) repeat protein
MSRSAQCVSASVVTSLAIFFSFILATTPSISAQASAKPLRASEVMALEAAGVFPANVVHDVNARGLAFQPDADFLSLMTKAGADASVISALKAAKVAASGQVNPDMDLLRKLSDAAVLMKEKKYPEAGAKLSEALDASFARMETGYVMAELMREEEQYQAASNIYAQMLQEAPDFPEVHTKASLVLYKLDDGEDALHEAKAALAENPDDAEAHKNAGLALDSLGKRDAAIAEYKEALRIKPDYSWVRLDLGNVFYGMHDYDESIAEYKKAIVLDPNSEDAHYNLGNAYKKKGEIGLAIAEFREAKRLNPNDPKYRQNLASALMTQAPAEAITELQELEQKFPNFEMCHICLGRALAWQGKTKEAEEEFRKANGSDPTDANGAKGLGSIQEQQKNYDAALENYRQAEQIAPGDAETHQDIGRILLAKRDYSGAIAELKQAEAAAPSSWEIHELFGQALLATGQNDLAIGEFKEAIALDATHPNVVSELGQALEKKGDWVGALEQYRKGMLASEDVKRKALPGTAFVDYSKECGEQYTAAQGRFADYLVSLKSAGRGIEAAELQKKVAMLDSSAGTKEKVEMAVKAGDQEFQQRKIEDAEKSYKQAVDLAQSLPPGDENLIVALGRLGNVYAVQRKYTEASVAFHQQLAIVEKTFGANSERSVESLQLLGRLAAFQNNKKEAESYLQRALAIETQGSGDNNPRAEEALRALAGLYETESDWPNAEIYLLRAVKSAESTNEAMVLIPLWGLCDMYDKWEKPEKSQPCWHRATQIMANQFGQDSPKLAESLKFEANALRKLKRDGEADQLEERLAKIQRTSASN